MGYYNYPINAMNTFEHFILNELNSKSRNSHFMMAEKLRNDGRTTTPYDIFATTDVGLFFMIEAKSTTRDFISLDKRFRRQIDDTYKRWLKYPKLHRGICMFAFMQDKDEMTLYDSIYAVFIQHLKFIVDYIDKIAESKKYTDRQIYKKLSDAGLTKTRIKKEFFFTEALPEEMPKVEFQIIKINMLKGRYDSVHADFNPLVEVYPIDYMMTPGNVDAGVIRKTNITQNRLM